MNKYIKTKDCDFWRLYWDSTTEDPKTDYDDRRLKQNWKDYTSDDPIKSMMAKTQIKYVHNGVLQRFLGKPLINYAEKVQEFGGIAINDLGGWCPIKDSEITELIYSDSEPSLSKANLVICENDKETYQEWIEEMKKYDSNPITLFWFGSRSQEEINGLLSDAKYVTFITTFTTFEWFIKMLKAAPKDSIIIGKCVDDIKWKDAELIAKKYNKSLKRVK